MRKRYPVGTRVRLPSGFCGTVTQLPRDIWQYHGSTIIRTYLGVEVCVQPDDTSYDIWFGISQVTREP